MFRAPRGVEVLTIRTLREFVPRLVPAFALYPLGLFSVIRFLDTGDLASLTTALICLLLPVAVLVGLYGSHQNQVWLTDSTVLVPRGVRGRPDVADLRQVIAVGLAFIETRPAGWRLVLWRSDATVLRMGMSLRAPRATGGMTRDDRYGLAQRLAASGLGQAAIRIRERAIAIQGPTSVIATDDPFQTGHVPA